MKLSESLNERGKGVEERKDYYWRRRGYIPEGNSYLNKSKNRGKVDKKDMKKITISATKREQKTRCHHN